MGEDNKTINELALEYMEKKYGEPFEYAGPYGDSTSGTHKLFATCGSLPEQVFIEIENYRKENKIFRDNYIAVKYKQEMADYLRNCAVSVFGGATVFYEVINEALPESIPADASFEVYLAESDVPVTVDIEINEKDYSDPAQIQKLAEIMADSGLQYHLTLVISSDERYGAADQDGLSEKIIAQDFAACVQVANLGNGIQFLWHEKE